MRKLSRGRLIKKLDSLFSKYIRRKDAINDIAKCVTCGVERHWKELQCGHFQSRRHYSTRWHENNTRPQCVKCNMFSQGEQYIFGKKLKDEIGDVMFDELILEKNRTQKYTLSDYKYLIEYYTKKLKELM